MGVGRTPRPTPLEDPPGAGESCSTPTCGDEESIVIRRFLDDGWLGALHPVQGYLILPTTLLLPLAAATSSRTMRMSPSLRDRFASPARIPASGHSQLRDRARTPIPRAQTLKAAR